MVLVDTSIWIRFLQNRSPYAAQLEHLLEQDFVLGHDLVYGELLIGDKGGRRILLEAFNQMHRVQTVPHEEVVEFVRSRKLHGRGAGWIDIHLLASALVSHCDLWTADPRLDVLAAELGVRYQA